MTTGTTGGIFAAINAAQERHDEARELRDALVRSAVRLGHSYSDIQRSTGLAKSSIHAIVSRVDRDGTR